MTAHALPGSNAHGPRSTSLAVTTAAPVLYAAEQFVLPYPITLHAVPGDGGTLLVEYRVDTASAWIAWPEGTVSATTIMVLSGPVNALRFTAGAANGTVALAM